MKYENIYYLLYHRMDICRCTVLNANESISFRWIIVVMIYMATIILCLSSESFDERFYILSNNVNTNNTSTSSIEMVRIGIGKIKCEILVENFIFL